MSIMTRSKRLGEMAPAAMPTSAPASPTRYLLSKQAGEAPEGSTADREAPESSRGRRAEAPDSGDGRARCLEQEFTRGRSQS